MKKTELRLFSWNVNGLRAVLKKGALVDFLEKENPDVLCLQEIKCKPDQVDFEKENRIFKDYEIFWNPAERPGYSGTATLVHKTLASASNEYPSLAQYPLDGDETAEKRDFRILAKTEGRVLVLDLGFLYLINVYTPNSKPDLSRLDLREKTWDPEFLALLKTLEKEKPIVTCGDFNAAHEEIDLARPKQNHRNAGFTDEERKGVSNLLNADLIDSFRFFNPDIKRYTWWSHWGKARENNVGWRIDYFFLSKALKPALKSAEIYEKYLGSDHCPVSITLEV